MRAAVNSACTVHVTSYLGMYAHISVDRTRVCSSCTVNIQQLASNEISVCLYITNSRQWTQPQSVDSTANKHTVIEQTNNKTVNTLCSKLCSDKYTSLTQHM